MLTELIPEIANNSIRVIYNRWRGHIVPLRCLVRDDNVVYAACLPKEKYLSVRHPRTICIVATGINRKHPKQPCNRSQVLSVDVSHYTRERRLIRSSVWWCLERWQLSRVNNDDCAGSVDSPRCGEVERSRVIPYNFVCLSFARTLQHVGNTTSFLTYDATLCSNRWASQCRAASCSRHRILEMLRINDVGYNKLSVIWILDRSRYQNSLAYL